MKALTLWQPWATLVAIGAKRIETRSWATSYRGPLAIHAAKRFTRKNVGRCFFGPFLTALLPHYLDFLWDPVWMPFPPLPTGVVVAICDLVDVQPIMTTDVPGEYVIGMDFARGGEKNVVTEPERSFGDFAPGRFAWMLENVQRLEPPIPARGRQRLWEWNAPEEWVR